MSDIILCDYCGTSLHDPESDVFKKETKGHKCVPMLADRIRELEAENKALREALKDALDEILTLYAWSDQVGLYDIEETPAVVKARAALEEKEDKTNE